MTEIGAWLSEHMYGSVWHIPKGLYYTIVVYTLRLMRAQKMRHFEGLARWMQIIFDLVKEVFWV